MCDTCVEQGISAIESYFGQVALRNPQIIWFYNAYKKFRNQLPANVLKEIENQFNTITNTTSKATADQAAVTLFVTYGLLFLITIFLFVCILMNNSTLTGVLMAISIILIIVAILFIFYYNSSTSDALAITIKSITKQLADTIEGAIEAGLCCAAGIDCNSSTSSCNTGATGGCNCLNVPIISFTATPTTGPMALNVTFNDTSTYPRSPDFIHINPPDVWEWDFGDGTGDQTATGTTTHIYNQRGTFRATMSVSLSYFGAGPYLSQPVIITVT
jgi:hypothetical protein